MRYRIHFHPCAVTMVVLEAIYKLVYTLHAYNSTHSTHLKTKTLSYHAAKKKSGVEKKFNINLRLHEAV